jgi:hypothetical protein
MPTQLLVPRDPRQKDSRQRRFDEIVSLILNGLIQSGGIVQGPGGTWVITTATAGDVMASQVFARRSGYGEW